MVSRCSLILALYGRPHSSDCAVNEHREIIAALARAATPRPRSRSWNIIWARSSSAPLLDGDRDAGFDLGAVLSRYTDALDGGSSAKIARLPKRKSQGQAMITAIPP